MYHFDEEKGEARDIFIFLYLKVHVSVDRSSKYLLGSSIAPVYFME